MAKGFKINGIVKAQKLIAQISGIEKSAKAHSIRAVQESILAVHAEAVQLIQGSSGGRPQVRYGPKRTVLAAPVGKPPNTDTGRLVQSIKFDFKNGGLIGRIGTNLKYGKFLEFGTKQMGPRPWLSTAIRNTSKDIAKIFESNLKKTKKDLKK